MAVLFCYLCGRLCKERETKGERQRQRGVVFWAASTDRGHLQHYTDTSYLNVKDKTDAFLIIAVNIRW